MSFKNNYRLTLIAVILLTDCLITNAFYLPGLAPVNYCEDNKSSDTCKSTVKLYVSPLDSEESLIPYDYSHFDFCQADSDSPAKNLGQVFGERIRISPYNISFLRQEECKFLCKKSYDLSRKEDVERLDLLMKGMLKNYEHHWIVDNIPITWCYPVEGDHRYCSVGFPMGCYVDSEGTAKGVCVMNVLYNKADTYYLFNHMDITITYHSGENEVWGTDFGENGGRIIAVRVVPRSIKHSKRPNLNPNDCAINAAPMEISGKLSKSDKLEIYFSYSIYFTKDNSIKWSERWDYINGDRDIHSYRMWNWLVIMFITGVVAGILFRTLLKDIARYNQMDSKDDAQEEFGWKSVHGDVFRPPNHSLLLSVFLGSGVQVLCTTVMTLLFACLGFLSPANRGALITFSVVLYLCLGTPAGYVSARIYKAFGGYNWKSNVMMTALLCPGIVFSLVFVMNLLLWAKTSSAAIPFTTLIALLALWFCVSLPLTFVGGYFGFKKRPIEHPVRINKIPRLIPEQSVYTRPIPGIIMGGILPFACIFIQLFLILNNIWSNQTYYMLGFLFLVFTILVISCSETTILLCYFHLCAEDYHWWWRSYLTSGFTAFYVFIYCIHYFMTKLAITGTISTLLYFGYTLIMVFLLFLISGTVGFFACFWFVRKIYSVVKVD